jgi:LVIVD repeat
MPGFNPANPGDFGFVNSDLAFQGNFAFVGNFNGFQIYDISDPANPTLRTAVVCPGGQGEVSVYGNLLFMSAEETRSRTDCGSPAVPSGDPLRFRGVRIFDISNLDSPQQVATVQTCRGSHTHTLLKSPSDDANLYVYVSGTSGVRSTVEMPSCKELTQPQPPNDPRVFDQGASRWRIEVIRVPLAAPQNAAVVTSPRLFEDQTTGQINSLQNFNPTPLHPSGAPWGPSPTTDSCHDITTYPELGLAAGACEGNGLLLDISDPANPVRIDAVADPNYAYWHGATFSNDGTKVVFTDEWGGGTSPRCRGADPVTGRQADQLNWGADAIFDIVDRKLVFRSYYKMPAVQSNQENCVAHLPSLIPVPGRDILVQAWYQAGPP